MNYHPDIKKAYRKFKRQQDKAVRQVLKLDGKHQKQREKLRVKQQEESKLLDQKIHDAKVAALRELNQHAEAHGTTAAAVLLVLNK